MPRAKGEKQQEFYLSALISVFTFPALGGLLFGYDIGATSFVVQQIVDGDHSGVRWDSLLDHSASLQGAITSASALGALLSSILVFKVADAIGRRSELSIGALAYLAGSFVEALSARPGWSSGPGIAVLILGRVVYGFGIGFSMHGAPAYIGEMSPPSIRGLLVSLKEASIVLGILMGFLVGYLFSGINGGWGYTYGIVMVPALLMFLGSHFILRESTRFLYLKNRKEEAKAAMDWVLTPDYSDQAFADMAEQTASIRQASVSFSEDLDAPPLPRTRHTSRPLSADPLSHVPPLDKSVWAKRFRPALIAGIGLVLLQQITGQPSVLYYAAAIFDEAGLAAVATVGVAAFKLIMTMVAVFTVDKFGRKLLLYVGTGIMLISLVALAVAFNFAPKTDDDDDNDEKKLNTVQIIILSAMFVYIGGYQIGFGPISWLLISEVFPLEVPPYHTRAQHHRQHGIG